MAKKHGCIDGDYRDWHTLILHLEGGESVQFLDLGKPFLEDQCGALHKSRGSRFFAKKHE